MVLKGSKRPPRGPQEASRGPQEASKRPPRGPQEAPKRPPRGHQEATKCSHMLTHAHTCSHMPARPLADMYTRVRTCSHTFTHVHTRSHMLTYVHTCPNVFTHVHTCAHMLTHVHTCSTWKRASRSCSHRFIQKWPFCAQAWGFPEVGGPRRVTEVRFPSQKQIENAHAQVAVCLWPSTCRAAAPLASSGRFLAFSKTLKTLGPFAQKVLRPPAGAPRRRMCVLYCVLQHRLASRLRILGSCL